MGGEATWGSTFVVRTLDEVIGGNLRRLREEAGMTQDEVGRALDWSRASVAGAEGGGRQFTVPDLVHLAAWLGVPASELLRGERVIIESQDADSPAVHATRLTTVREVLATASQKRRVRGLPLSPGARKRLEESPGEAERKLAASLGVTPEQVLAASQSRWGTSLTRTRDSLLRHPSGSDRTLQALRGHVTRQLKREVIEELTKLGVLPKTRRR